jgi:iron complex outermembrane receptor protein
MSRIFPGCVALLLAAALPAQADDGIETVIVTGAHNLNAPAPLPGIGESVTAQRAEIRSNAVTSEDLLEYLPDILVRERHFGDTQAPVTSRTSGVGASARSLIYADGILLSALIGNNNGTASPHWGLVAPEDVERIDVLYGPFRAEYPGNSLGSVILITTRMPDQFETYAKAATAFQDFSQYGTKGAYDSYQMSAGIGDRAGDLSWRLSLDHLDSSSQPLAFVTLAKSTSAPSAGVTDVSGAIFDVNRTGAPITVIGAGGFEHQVEDTASLRLEDDLSSAWRVDYTANLFHQDDDATAQSYLKDQAGNPVYAGPVTIDGAGYSIPASAFSANVYHWGQTQLAQGLSLKSDDDGAWRWEFIASRFDTLKDAQRLPSLALPAATAGGAGNITRMNGTGWQTFDAKGVWTSGGNELSFGAHRDVYALDSTKYVTADWLAGDVGALASQANGKTATNALWMQDIWSFAPDFKAILGGRLEDWRAYQGRNFSLSPPLAVNQPKEHGAYFSPKFSLAWQADRNWSVAASFGMAYRMPTVGELYQVVTTGPTLSVPNPDLKPEQGRTFDLTAMRAIADGHLRLSLFQEDLSNALLSQTALLTPGSTILSNFVQNVPRLRSRGIEMVLEQDDILPGLDFSGSATYVDSRILRDAAFPAAVGKYNPGIPRFRATASATYRATDALSVTLSARYSDRVFATIDNSDTVAHAWQGFDGYLVADLRLHYRITGHWSAAAGIDNLTDRKYFLFHPFPQRTFLLDLRYAD